MSSIPATTERPAPTESLARTAQRCTARLSHSLAAQIALAITLVSVLLMVTACWMASRMLAQEFDAISAPAVLAQAQTPAVPLQIARLEAKRQEFVERAWRIVFVTVTLGALAAGLFAWWFTHRMLASARRLSTTADRISAQSLRERVHPGDHPSELEPVARAFNRMLDRLEDAFARLSGFSSDLAHDLRAPIHRLMSAAQVTLSRPRSNDEYRALLEASIEDYERIGRLIDNILFLARADHAQTRIHAVWVALPARMQSIAEFFELLADERGVRMAWQVDSTHGTQAWADETLLGRAVGNLLTNAIRHARPGSTVVLSARRQQDGGSTVTVSNEGDPIAPEHQAGIFQRRYRLETATGEAEPGSGLGLAIVQSVMHLHGGSASVHSAPGQPTVFTLAFPAPRRRPLHLRPAAR